MKYFSIGKKIVLYWDKYQCDSYDIFLDGLKIGKSVFSFYELEFNDYYFHSVEIKYIKNNNIVKSIIKKVKIKKINKVIDVTKPPYNAIGDGKTLNTTSLQKAIDDCKSNQQIYIPSGIFLTGALTLHSNMELFVEKGGMLKGTSNVNDYLPMIDSRFEGIERKTYKSLINIGTLNHKVGYNIKNIKIYGNGTIIGGGVELLYNTMNIKGKNETEKKDNLQKSADDNSLFANKHWRQRGRLFQISNANNIIETYKKYVCKP